MSVISKILGELHYQQIDVSPFTTPPVSNDSNDWTVDFYNFMYSTPIETYYVPYPTFVFQGKCYVCRVLGQKSRTATQQHLYINQPLNQVIKDDVFKGFYTELVKRTYQGEKLVLYKIEDTYEVVSAMYITRLRGLII